MTPEQITIAFLSSSVLSAAIGALIAGRFNLITKNREYENDYFKLVLAKRIKAYESVQILVTGLKTAVVDNDRQPYHALLSHEEDLPAAYKLLTEITSHALWLSDDLFIQTRDLGRLLFGASDHQDGVIGFAKQHYQKLATLREEIERLHLRDMLSLHKVPKFLKAKRVASGFSEVQLGS